MPKYFLHHVGDTGQAGNSYPGTWHKTQGRGINDFVWPGLAPNATGTPLALGGYTTSGSMFNEYGKWQTNVGRKFVQTVQVLLKNCGSHFEM